MNKHVKISLIVLVAVVMLLALTIPVLAKKPIDTDPNCFMAVPIINKSGNNDAAINVYGALDAYWEGGVLYNYCTGIIPWGEETSNPGWRFITFNELMNDFFEGYGECEPNYCWADETNWVSPTQAIYDPDAGITLETDNFYAAVYRNGQFLFNKVYDPSK